MASTSTITATRHLCLIFCSLFLLETNAWVASRSSQWTWAPQRRRERVGATAVASTPPVNEGATFPRDDDISSEDEWEEFDDVEVLDGSGSDFSFDDDDDNEEDWIPDSFKMKEKPKHLTPANEVVKPSEQRPPQQRKAKETSDVKTEQQRKSPYTEEEEDLIRAMGGKQSTGREKKQYREEGFLGDCTLMEISRDYSVPVCYLADVLCMWEVPVPINVDDRLGDLVTGEQAFAIVEAVNSLDVAALQDRYSNQSLQELCDSWDIKLKEAFEFAMKEGWSLPFGVRTNLRVEQEDELLRVMQLI